MDSILMPSPVPPTARPRAGRTVGEVKSTSRIYATTRETELLVDLVQNRLGTPSSALAREGKNFQFFRVSGGTSELKPPGIATRLVRAGISIGEPPTMSASPLTASNKTVNLHHRTQTGRRLSEFAVAVGLPFSFRQCRLEPDGRFRSKAVKTVRGEAVVFNCALHAPHQAHHAARSVGSFLAGAAEVSPRVIAVVEESGGGRREGSGVVGRFVEEMEGFAMEGNKAREMVERAVLAPRIAGAVGRAYREDEEGRRWGDWMAEAGYRKLELSSFNYCQTKQLIGLFNLHNRWTGRRLSEFAVAVGLPFSFRQCKLEPDGRFRSKAVKTVRGEAVVFNCALHAPHQAHHAARSIGSFLAGAAEVSPRVIAVVEESGGGRREGSGVVGRFVEEMVRYSAIWDTMEAGFAMEGNKAREMVERAVLAPRIARAVGRAYREDEEGRRWGDWMAEAGYRKLELSSFNYCQTKQLIGLFNLHNRWTGRRLSEFAVAVGLPFSFRQCRLEPDGRFRSKAVKTVRGEAVVFNCALHAPHQAHHAARSVGSFLAGAAEVSPRVIAVVEESGGGRREGSGVVGRFVEEMVRYSAIWDAMEAGFAMEGNKAREMVERAVLAPRIAGAVGRAYREDEEGRRWGDWMAEAGYRKLELSSFNYCQTKQLIGLFKDTTCKRLEPDGRFRSKAVKMVRGKAVVFNCALHAPHQAHHAARSVGSFLAGAAEVSPRVIAVVEESGGGRREGSGVVGRFVEEMVRYSAIWDAMEAGFAMEGNKAREMVERAVLAPRIAGAVGRAYREDEEGRRWGDWMAEAGYRKLELSSFNYCQTKQLIGLLSEGYGLEQDALNKFTLQGFLACFLFN
ncbi:Nodulation-signaling pathway 2 protein [Platanthera zijinensis]|uniref:Nodulation-signaling pathway 2 protein n=1 Tax=Platanthera zijinensis TaxID=2320716 RepID=A0AAP0AZI9_9ASPA